MKLHQIITSLLSTDLYKLSMGQAIYHQFSDYKTTWTFKCRNKDVHFTEEMVNVLADKDEVKRILREERVCMKTALMLMKIAYEEK